MSNQLLPKKAPSDFKKLLFIFYQIIIVFAIIVASIATYTAVKNGKIGEENNLFTRVYREKTNMPMDSGRIETTALDASSAGAATAAFMWSIVVVLAAFWYKVFFLFKEKEQRDIIKHNHPILIMLIVVCVIAGAVFAYDAISTTWIKYYHYNYPGDKMWVSYAKMFDGNDLATEKGISFANIWNCTVAYAFFSALVFACFVPAVAFSAKTYNNWRITA